MRAAFRMAAVTALTLLVCRSDAQSAASQIVGQVSDPSGAGVPDVTFEVRNLETGVERRAISNTEGYYLVPLLAPGTYRIAVHRTGFRPIVRSGIRLAVNQTLKLDVALSLGTVSATVQVTEAEPLLQRATTELGTVVDQKTISDLPLNGRDLLQLLSLTPGVTGRSVNGQWAAGNLYHLDGVNNTTVLNSTAALIPVLDTVREFKVQSHNDKAEFGGVLGGIVNVVSRSGTNDPHGSVWEFARNDIFDARNPFTDALRNSPPAFRQNQFGATFGGPILLPRIYNGSGRTFFFSGYEGYRFRRPDAALARVPSDAELGGDFSLLGRPIFDPSATRIQSGVGIRDPFPGNVLPASRLVPMMRVGFEALYDRPNYSGDSFFNRLNAQPFANDRDTYSIKVDHSFGQRNGLSVRYSQSDESRLSQRTESIASPWSNNRKNLGISWMSIISRDIVLDSRFSRASHPIRARDVLGLPSAGRYGNIESLTSAGFSAEKLNRYALPDLALGAPWSSPAISGESIQAGGQPFSLSLNLAWTRNRHSWQFGFEMVRSVLDNVGRGHHVYFSDAQTGDPARVGQTGASLASALLGMPNSVAYTLGEYRERFSIWSGYVQDAWKLTPSVTLNWGLRYDQFPSPDFTRGIISLWDFRSGDWLIGTRNLPPPCSLRGKSPCIPGDGRLDSLPFGNHIRLADYAPGVRHPIRDNFGPRAGVAWNFRHHMVLRAGYGVLFDTYSATAQDLQNPVNSWPVANDYQRYLNDAGGPQTSIENIERNPILNVPAATPWDTAGWFWDPAKKNAFSHQWNIELQRQSSEHLMASLAYVGSASSRLDMIVAANAARTPGPGSAQDVIARKPFPYMVTTQYGTDWGRGSYHALQAKVQREFAGGMQYLLAYTWSKSIDNAASSWYGRGPQDTYNPDNSRGPSNYDRTHVLVLSGIFELPAGPGKRWLQDGWASKLLGNWQANTITTLQSGLPFDLLVPGDVANVGNVVRNYARPNVIGDPVPATRTYAEWYAPTAFAVPNFSFGNFGRNVLRSAPLYNCDLSLFKVLRITESVRGELRVEAFNAFNLMNPGPPVATLTNSNAGKITSIAARPRELQFGLRLVF